MHIQDTTTAVQWIQIKYAAGPGDWLGCEDGRGTKAKKGMGIGLSLGSERGRSADGEAIQEKQVPRGLEPHEEPSRERQWVIPSHPVKLIPVHGDGGAIRNGSIDLDTHLGVLESPFVPTS